MSAYIELINSVGFPIAMVLIMLWQNTAVINKNTEAINALAAKIDILLAK